MATLVLTEMKTVTEEEKEKEREEAPRGQVLGGAAAEGGLRETRTPVTQIFDPVTVNPLYRNTIYERESNEFVRPDGTRMDWQTFQEIGIRAGNAPVPLTNDRVNRAPEFVADRGAQWAPAALQYVMVETDPRAPQNRVFVNTLDFTERIPIGPFLRDYVIYSQRSYDTSRPRHANAELRYNNAPLSTAGDVYKDRNVDKATLNLRIDYVDRAGAVSTIKKKLLTVPLDIQRWRVLGVVARILGKSKHLGSLDPNDQSDCRNRGLGSQLRNPWLYEDETPDDDQMKFWEEKFTLREWIRAQPGMEAAPLKNISINARVYCTGPRERRRVRAEAEGEAISKLEEDLEDTLADVSRRFEDEAAPLVAEEIRRRQAAIALSRQRGEGTLAELGAAKRARRELEPEVSAIQRQKEGAAFREAREDLEEALARQRGSSKKRRVIEDDDDDDEDEDGGPSAPPAPKKRRKGDTVDAQRQTQVVETIYSALEDLSELEAGGRDEKEASEEDKVRLEALREIIFYGITAPPKFMGDDVDYEQAFYTALRRLQKEWRKSPADLQFLASIEDEYSERARQYAEKIQDRFVVPVFVDGVVTAYLPGPLRGEAIEAAPFGVEEKIIDDAEEARHNIIFLECDKCHEERCVYDFEMPFRNTIALEGDKVLQTCYDVVIFTADTREHRGGVNLVRNANDPTAHFFKVFMIEDEDEEDKDVYELRDPTTDALQHTLPASAMATMQNLPLATNLWQGSDGKRYVQYGDDDSGTTETWPSPVVKIVCLQRDGAATVYDDPNLLKTVEGIDDIPFQCGDVAEAAANAESHALLNQLRHYRDLLAVEDDPFRQEELRTQMRAVEEKLHQRPALTEEEIAEVTSAKFTPWADVMLAENARTQDAAANRADAALAKARFVTAEAGEAPEDEEGARMDFDVDIEEEEEAREERDRFQAQQAMDKLAKAMKALASDFTGEAGALTSNAIAMRNSIVQDVQAISDARLRTRTAQRMAKQVEAYLAQIQSQAQTAADVDPRVSAFIHMVSTEIVQPLNTIVAASARSTSVAASPVATTAFERQSQKGPTQASYASHILADAAERMDKLRLDADKNGPKQSEQKAELTNTKGKGKKPTLHDEVVALMREYPQGIGSETVARLIHQRRKEDGQEKHKQRSSDDTAWWRNWRAQVRHAINPNQRLKNDTFLVYPGTHYYVLREHITPENIPTIMDGLRARSFNKMDGAMETFARSTLEKASSMNRITKAVDEHEFLSVRDIQRYGLKSKYYGDIKTSLLRASDWSASEEETDGLLKEWVSEYVHKVPIASNRVPPPVDGVDAPTVVVEKSGSASSAIDLKDMQKEAKKLYQKITERSPYGEAYMEDGNKKAFPLTIAELAHMANMIEIGEEDVDAKSALWMYVEKLVMAYAAAQAASPHMNDEALWTAMLAKGPSRARTIL